VKIRAATAGAQARAVPGRFRRDESGAALVEFALVFGLFVFILYALIAFGMMFAAKQSLTNAAAEGARSVVGVVDNPATSGVDERVEKAKVTVAQRLNWLGNKYVESTDLAATIETCAGSATAQCVRVKITYPYQARPLIPPAPGLGLVTPTSFKSEAVVQVSQ